MMWHYTPTRADKMKKGYDEDVEQLSSLLMGVSTGTINFMCVCVFILFVYFFGCVGSSLLRVGFL